MDGRRETSEAESYLQVLEVGYFEVTEAFKGLADGNVWERPAEGLLSVGELAGHIAYWEAARLAGEGGESEPGVNGISVMPDLVKCRVSSPLVDHRFGYYTGMISTRPSEQHLAMTAQQVCRELVRVHEEAVGDFRARNPEMDGCPPGWPPGHTYGEDLRYLAFHVAYHTGQMYSARHLLGEQTPDN